MLNYREEQNHRWAHNLAAAKQYFWAGERERFYRGDIAAAFKFPGMKILGAFWTAENMEMKLRLGIHLDVLPLDDEVTYELLATQSFRRFLDDVREMSRRFDLFTPSKLEGLLFEAEKETLIPANWEELIIDLEERSETMIATGVSDSTVLQDWFDYSLRHVLSYSHNLIRQSVRTALYVKFHGQAALEAAIDPTIEYFSWKINRVFFNESLPMTGFSGLADVIDLGAYGMLADQDVSPSSERKYPDHTEKRSYLNTCQLYGFFEDIARLLGQPKGCTTHAYCRFCLGHGRTTMHFVIPPELEVKYSLEEGLGYGAARCTFLLETKPGIDDGRCDHAAAKIFGDEELSYK